MAMYSLAGVGTTRGYTAVGSRGKGHFGWTSGSHLRGVGLISFARKGEGEKTFRSKLEALPAQVGELKFHQGGHGRGRCGIARASAGLAAPLIAAGDTWGTWTVLVCAGAFGIWSEKTNWGSALSGALVSTLVGLAASNLGLIASSAPAYNVVNSYLLPLAVPLLLYGADLRRVIKDTGRLIIAFLLGSAVNYVAVSEALGTTPSIVAAGLAADNLICAIYFTTLFALAANIPPDASKPGEPEAILGFGGQGLKVEETATALALSAVICTAGNLMAKALNLQGGGIPCITAIVVIVATVFPSFCGKISTSGSGLAIILLQIFFASIGANASITSVMTSAPGLFLFSLVQVAVHLAMILGVGKLCGFQRKELLMASNANVGGPSTAAGMAAAKGWRTLSVPGILIGIFGIAIATFVSIILGVSWLSKALNDKTWQTNERKTVLLTIDPIMNSARVSKKMLKKDGSFAPSGVSSETAVFSSSTDEQNHTEAKFLATDIQTCCCSARKQDFVASTSGWWHPMLCITFSFGIVSLFTGKAFLSFAYPRVPQLKTEARHEDGDEDETSEGRTRAAAAARNKKLVKLAFFALALLACNSGSHAALAVAESSIAASSLGVKVASFLRGSGWPDELVVLTVAMLPVLELRGAIPISYWLRVDPIKGYFIAVLGNMLPVPLIVLYLDKLSTFLGERSSTAKKVLDWVFERTRKKGGVIEEFEWLGLMLFVAVPFPGTGAWTGAILAAILGMPFWEAMTANFFGVVLAGLLVNIVVTVGGKAALGVGAVLFAISTFMWTVLRMIRNKKNEDA
ncbi:hypothetical protein AXG93_773s1020 [Marchantia polymorpha subsp. ruderalis]|uniref:Uncharacterized protein n=1 Tax=Marchantia polymorpha subsp. ruderalis TaxID=1480154 RepID=A0A176WA14_MARPO|nr:hypothetical protein AXG93_773s1020 [Marchantia polymorpha subsp. ruderalis]